MTYESSQKIFEEIMNSTGREKGNLLRVLNKAMIHNLPNAYRSSIHTVIIEGDHLENNITDEVALRAGLIQRHMRDAQNALTEIYKLAKKNGYTDIAQIFEREYRVGHPDPHPNAQE